jgi:hypothetical protein
MNTNLGSRKLGQVVTGILMAGTGGYQLFIGLNGLVWWILLLCGVGVIIQGLLRKNRNSPMASLSR